MKIVLLSNYFSHHQKQLSEELYEKMKEDFTFICTSKMRDERRKLGYDYHENPGFIKKTYENQNKEKCQNIIDEADIVITGSAPEEFLLRRHNEKKIVIRYSERLYKKGIKYYKLPIRILRFRKLYSANKNQYLLCASAYTAADFSITNNFKKRAYKWGYFPQTIDYDIDMLLEKKNVKKILWCGRFIEWKHPDLVVDMAKRLSLEGYDFEIAFIGAGELEKQIKDKININGLNDRVCILGSMNPIEVRRYMEETGIYLFTSDFQEGWGAVLNEAMNSGCAVIASHAIGAVPYLVKHYENGIIYKNGDAEDLYNKVKYLLVNPDEQKRLGKSAYNTIIKTWNANVAATRLLEFISEINKKGYCDLYDEGPCSKAEIIKNNWFKD